MKLAMKINTVIGLCAVVFAPACGSDNNSDNTTTVATGGNTSATGGKGAGGNTSATGGKASGGANATGGAVAATGGTVAGATGGASSTGGSKSTGGSNAAPTGGTLSTGGSNAVATGGVTATGGRTGTGGSTTVGGSTATNVCVADTSTITKFCRPSSSSVNISGSAVTLNGVRFAPNGTTIAVTSAAPVTSGTSIAGVSPFNDATCAGAGVDAEVAGSDPAVAYTGMSLSITNSGTVPITISMIFDDRTATGLYVQRTYSLGPVPADATAHSYSLTWNAVAHTDSCNLPSGSTFDQTHILGLGFGIVYSGAPTTLNATLSNIVFTTN